MAIFSLKKAQELEVSIEDTASGSSSVTKKSASANKEEQTEKEISPLKAKLNKLWNFMVIDGTEGLPVRDLFLYNYDLRPLEEKRRTWSKYNYIYFCISECFNVNTWQIAGTGVQNGLSWWTCYLAVWLGYFFCGLFIATFAKYGNAYHVSFPVSCRSSFGIWGSLWPVFNRVVMACVWFGVQSTIGGNCVELMLRSIFGNDLETRIHNTIPASANITSFKMLCFFLYWLSQIPFICCPPHKLRHLFTVKAAICPIAGFGFLAWALVKSPNVTPMLHAPSELHGSQLGWTFVSSTMGCLSNLSTLIINSPDFGRLANKPGASFWSQLITTPLAYSTTCLIGILVSAASKELYGETFWNPLDVLSRFLDHMSPGSRAGVFFISTGFAISQLGSNIAANSLSAGTDMTAIFPKFINIRRGSIICALIGFAMCPWNLMTSSSRFTTYLSAYSVFLSAIAGCIFGDYFLIRKGYIKLQDLYLADNSSFYYYKKGINYRAYAAYILGIVPNIVGFVGATGTHTVPIGATHTFEMSFFTGFLSSAACILIITMIWPVRGMPDCKLFERKFFEEWQDVENFDEEFRLNHGFTDDKRNDLHPLNSLV